MQVGGEGVLRKSVWEAGRDGMVGWCEFCAVALERVLKASGSSRGPGVAFVQPPCGGSFMEEGQRRKRDREVHYVRK